jgi:hypothetical protein
MIYFILDYCHWDYSRQFAHGTLRSFYHKFLTKSTISSRQMPLIHFEHMLVPQYTALSYAHDGVIYAA